MSTKNFYIIDSSSLIYKCFHGMPVQTSRDGLPNNAIEGVIRTLDFLFKQHKIDYIAAAWGSKAKTFRHELYPDYKAKRDPAPKELGIQVPYIKKAFDAFGITSVINREYETDDVIATLAVTMRQPDWNSIIYSTDKDFRQLLCDEVCMFDHRKVRFITAEDHYRDWGIKPDQVVDFLALTGDLVDNIPGVKGIGKLNATYFINEYGTLDNILEAELDPIKFNKHQKIKDAADQARMSRELVRLRTDVPITKDPEDFRARWPDLVELVSLTRQCGLHKQAGNYEWARQEREGIEQ